MDIKIVKIENPQQLNLILGQSHFIKTVEDMHEAIVSTVPGAKFGLAFCEASDVCLVRHSGTDPELLELAKKNALPSPPATVLSSSCGTCTRSTC